LLESKATTHLIEKFIADIWTQI